ncbi:Partitioning defective 3 B [Liparis tanakae]|uniref:Partitioning defective 3 B n=1 Tax=Liparis tanakae TaxID=230148 RepID=A0A4Z2JFJ2_9TELE|nr:Partitioning defective 3 B [Liparis tanakae]
MKVTVTFGQTGVVVPCKEGWTVRDLIQQATQRYRKLLEQEGDFLVRTHHVEYCDGGILDPDDTLSDLVEDKDKQQMLGEDLVTSYMLLLKFTHFYNLTHAAENCGQLL